MFLAIQSREQLVAAVAPDQTTADSSTCALGEQLESIDFDNETLLIAAVGSRSTGGFSLLIRSIETRSNELVVSLVDLSPDPGPNCIVTTVVTYPHVLAIVPKWPRPVSFRIFRGQSDCGPPIFSEVRAR